MRFNKLLAAALIAVVPATVHAADADKGFYAGLNLGANMPLNADIDGTGVAGNADLDTGFTGLGAFGYDFGNDWRTELEAGYRTNDNEGHNNITGQGDVKVWSLMGNLLHDFDLKNKWTPYLGAGLGFAKVDFDGITPLGINNNNGSYSDNSSSWAYQLMAGTSYELNEALDATLGYRFFGTPDHSGNTSRAVAVDTEYHTHDITLGLVWHFGKYVKKEPKPEMKMAAAPAAPKAEPYTDSGIVPSNYLVFFDLNKTTLTTDAKAIVAKAAKDFKATGRARIDVTGHADRSGTIDHNMALSRSRAEAVQNELMKNGLTKKDIQMYAKGESSPLVPTADGVREPQNRRVEIVQK